MTGVLFAGTSVEYYGVETGSGKIERYFVSYASYGQIFVFDGNFTHISTFATPGTGEDNLYFPSGMHAKYNDDNTCDLYIADSYNNRISVWKYTPDAANPLNDSSSHLVNYGSIGVNPGQFIYPTDVSLSSSGGIYVADMNNNRVQYTTDTTTWHTIGEKGYEAPDLFLPIGVTVSSASGSELLYVVDLLNRAIKVYSLDGDFLYSYPIKGKDPRYNYPNALGFLKGQMWMPFGCFTDGKFVHLPDSALSRVNVYKLS
jgi:WD40 repeat protein